MRRCAFIAGVIACLVLMASGTSSAQTAPEVIRVDTAAPTRPFPHFWEQMFGSGHANLTMRESWRHDLRTARAVTDFRYVRFHDIFHDHNGVYSEGKDGTPIYNWSYVDQIYDGLLANGVRPFVELSFMPSALAASQKPHPFWYKPLPNPPDRTRSGASWSSASRGISRIVMERMRSDSGTSRSGTSRTSISGRGSPRRTPISSFMNPPRVRSSPSTSGYAWAGRRPLKPRGSAILSGIAPRRISRSISSRRMSMGTTAPGMS